MRDRYDFGRVFSPTEEETAFDAAVLQSLIQEQRMFWVKLGFSETEIDQIERLEESETSKLGQYESHYSREELLSDGLITLEDVKNDLRGVK